MISTEVRDQREKDLLIPELQRLNTTVQTLESRIAEVLETLVAHSTQITAITSELSEARADRERANYEGSGRCLNGSLEPSTLSRNSTAGMYQGRNFEELVRLISAELEQVRAELKQNSGRWKIGREVFTGNICAAGG